MVDRLVYNRLMAPQKPALTHTSSARDRILRTAHDLFYRDGIRATGIDRVIAESSVAKLTFYRHFPSKNDLIRAYLEYRHGEWTAWFVGALARYGGNPGAIVPAVAEWLRSPTYRGCAFLNSVGELAGVLPDVCEITRSHKEAMAAAIAEVLPPSHQRAKVARAVSLAIDGAAVRAQFDVTPDAALDALKRIVKSLVDT